MLSKNQLKQHRQLEMKKYRQREGVFVAEGPKVVGDLLAAGYEPRMLYATQQWIAATGHQTAQEVDEEELRKLSFLQHPQQVVAEFFMKRIAETLGANEANTESVYAEGPKLSSGLYLALDGVQDPGNLGTIIRIADWFGINTIFCSEDTADAWNPKVVQATMGSIARVNIIYTSLARLISNTTLPVYGTLLDGRNIYEETLTKDGIIVMGNEGNGISQDIRQLITRKLLIPQFHEGPESLNVAIATAITCSEFRRR